MKLFEKKDKVESRIQDLKLQLAAQAIRLGISVIDLTKLGAGKSCPKYGTNELLHARRVRGGKIAVFNISEKYRGEKISEGRKKTKANKIPADRIIDEDNKK